MGKPTWVLNDMSNDRRSRADRALRLTVVSRIYTPEPSAGSMRLQALVDELLRRGHEVTVLTTTPPRSIPLREEPTEAVHRWPVLRDRAGYVRGYAQYLSYDLPLFFRVLFAKRPDAYIVEPPPTTGMIMLVACWLLRRPYIYYAADIWSDAASMTGAAKWVVAAVRWVEKRVLAGASGNLVVSQGVANRIESMAPGAASAVVGHGVDTDLFSADGATVAESADVVYVGTMSEWHGARLAIEALALVMRRDADITAAFIGQGAEKEDMIALARELGLSDRIRFMAPVPAAEAARWVRSARVALATLKPGAGYDFAVPTKLYAALAVGTPVAYAGPTALRNVIEQDNLGEAASFTAEDYADAIMRLLPRSSTQPDGRLVEWAQRNVSARSVAVRSAEVVEKITQRLRTSVLPGMR